MIYIKKAKKKNLDLLIKYKLETIIPYIKDNDEKLKIISYVNNFMKDNYVYAYIIYNNFTIIGGYLVYNNFLDLLYIENEYRGCGYGSKIVKKVSQDILYIWIMKENKRALNFYKKFNFIKVGEKNNRYLLKRS